MTSQHDKAKRWQFSMRTALFCVTIVAMTVGWWDARKRYLQEVELLNAKIDLLEDKVEFQEETLQSMKNFAMEFGSRPPSRHRVHSPVSIGPALPPEPSK